MKTLKILSLAGLVAAAITVVIGGGTVSAQVQTRGVFCQVTPTNGICSSGNIYPSFTQITGQLVAGTTLTTTPEGEQPENVCKKATFSAKSESTTTPTGKQTLSFSECSLTTEVLESGTLTVHHDGLHNGNVTYTGIRVRKKALFGSLSCDFGGTITEGVTLTGGNPAKLDITAKVPMIQETGFIECPPNVIMHGEFEVTSPNPLFVGTEE